MVPDSNTQISCKQGKRLLQYSLECCFSKHNAGENINNVQPNAQLLLVKSRGAAKKKKKKEKINLSSMYELSLNDCVTGLSGRGSQVEPSA